MGYLARRIQAEFRLFGQHAPKQSNIRRTGAAFELFDQRLGQLRDRAAALPFIGQCLPVIHEALCHPVQLCLAQIEQDGGPLSVFIQFADQTLDKRGQNGIGHVSILNFLGQPIAQLLDDPFGAQTRRNLGRFSKNRRVAHGALQTLG